MAGTAGYGRLFHQPGGGVIEIVDGCQSLVDSQKVALYSSRYLPWRIDLYVIVPYPPLGGASCKFIAFIEHL